MICDSCKAALSAGERHAPNCPSARNIAPPAESDRERREQIKSIITGLCDGNFKAGYATAKSEIAAEQEAVAEIVIYDHGNYTEMSAQFYADALKSGKLHSGVKLYLEQSTPADLKNQIVCLTEALKKLSFAAQTSGGIAGADEGLQAAINEAEGFLCRSHFAPAGWQIVPKEPTEAMIDAYCDLAVQRIRRRLKDDNDCPGIRASAAETYKAMLAVARRDAAPKEPK